MWDAAPTRRREAQSQAQVQMESRGVVVFLAIGRGEHVFQAQRLQMQRGGHSSANLLGDRRVNRANLVDVRSFFRLEEDPLGPVRGEGSARDPATGCERRALPPLRQVARTVRDSQLPHDHSVRCRRVEPCPAQATRGAWSSLPRVSTTARILPPWPGSECAQGSPRRARRTRPSPRCSCRGLQVVLCIVASRARQCGATIAGFP